MPSSCLERPSAREAMENFTVVTRTISPLPLALDFSPNLRFRSDQRVERAKSREVLREKFFIFDSDPQVTFHKGNQANEPERVDLERLVRVGDRRQWRPRFVEIFLEFRRYVHPRRLFLSGS